MKTRAEVDKLKADWLKNPYDFEYEGCEYEEIYLIEGFENYHDELKQFQEEHQEKIWQHELTEKANELGVSVEVADKISNYEYKVESSIDWIKKALSHYCENSAKNDICIAIDKLLEAATYNAKIEILKEMEKKEI